MWTRRTVLKGGAALLASGGTIGGSTLASLAADTVTLPFDNGERPLVTYPQKRAMIGLTARPPQLETPFAVFDENIITPNDAFFVRYHLSNLPTDIDPETFRLDIKGKVDKPSSLSLAEIRALPSVELVASISAPATAAASSRRASPAGNSATARWAMRNGPAFP